MNARSLREPLCMRGDIGFTLSSLFSRNVTFAGAATAYGLMQAVQNLGLAVISMVAGMIVDQYGYMWLEVRLVSVPVFGCAPQQTCTFFFCSLFVRVLPTRHWTMVFNTILKSLHPQKRVPNRTCITDIGVLLCMAVSRPCCHSRSLHH